MDYIQYPALGHYDTFSAAWYSLLQNSYINPQVRTQLCHALKRGHDHAPQAAQPLCKLASGPRQHSSKPLQSTMACSRRQGRPTWKERPYTCPLTGMTCLL